MRGEARKGKPLAMELEPGGVKWRWEGVSGFAVLDDNPILGMIKPNMGSSMGTDTAHSALADALFPGTKQRVLGLLFGQPWRSFYASEVIGLVASGSGVVQRELAVLTKSGLISMKPIGNQKHYQANPDSPIYAELSAIVQKTVGLGTFGHPSARPIRRGTRFTTSCARWLLAM